MTIKKANWATSIGGGLFSIEKCTRKKEVEARVKSFFTLIGATLLEGWEQSIQMYNTRPEAEKALKNRKDNEFFQEFVVYPK